MQWVEWDEDFTEPGSPEMGMGDPEPGMTPATEEYQAVRS